MVQSISYLVFFTLMGAALFLGFLPRLTIEEKTRAFVMAIALGPVAALFFNGALFTFHDTGYAGQGDIRGDDAALHLLSVLIGLAVSGAVMWGARHVSQSRSYQDFVAMQQRLAYAKAQALLAVEQRKERMLQGQVQLATLQVQDRYLAIHQAAAANLTTALAQQEQKLRLAYSSYCSTVDPMNEQDQSALIDAFRGEIRRPRFIRGKLDIDLLSQSGDPLVKKVLHGRSTINLTPDD